MRFCLAIGLLAALPACVGRSDLFRPAIETMSVEAVYPAHPAWNDHVALRNANADADHQDDLDCDPAVDVGEGGPARCLHAGERRMATLRARASCAGLAYRDDLGLWGWRCVEADGQVLIYSTGLAAGRTLRDLLESDGFRANRLTVIDEASGLLLGASEATSWWPNQVQPLPANPTGAVAVLDVPGGIYTLAASAASNGYNVAADRIAIVTLDNATLGFGDATAPNCSNTGAVATAGVKALVCSGGRAFLWVELDMLTSVASAVDVPLYLTNQRFPRIQTTRIDTGVGAALLRCDDCWSGRFEDLLLRNAGQRGFMLVGGQYNVVHRISIVGAHDNALHLTAGSHDNRIFDYRVANVDGAVDDACVIITGPRNKLVNGFLSNCSAYGLRIQAFSGENSFDTTVVNVVSVGSGSPNVIVQDAASGTTLMNVTAASSASYGLHLIAPQNTLSSNLLLVDNALTGLIAVGDALNGSLNGNRFRDLMALGNDAAQPTPRQVTMSVTPGFGTGQRFDGELWVSTATGACRNVQGNAGQGLFDGTCSDSGTEGSSSYGSELSTAVLHVAVDGGGLFASPGCTTATCTADDWRLAAAGSVARAHHGTLVDGAACPPSVDGNVVAVDSQAVPNTFLLHAIEITLDGVGDDDGLCESNEACIFAPNVGAYQGEGDPSTTRCLFSDGAVRGVTMHGFPQNGG